MESFGRRCAIESPPLALALMKKEITTCNPIGTKIREKYIHEYNSWQYNRNKYIVDITSYINEEKKYFQLEEDVYIT